MDLVLPDSLDHLDLTAAQDLRALWDPMARQDQMVTLGLQAHLGRRVLRVLREIEVTLGSLVHRDNKALQVGQTFRVLKSLVVNLVMPRFLLWENNL